MSYILDALRRAEAERGRGGVPGLHTQATPVPGALPPEGRPASASLVMVAVGVLVVAALAAGGTWWALQRNAPTSGVVLAGAQTVATPKAPAAPSAPSAPSASAPVAAPPLTPLTPLAPVAVVPATPPPKAAAAPTPAAASKTAVEPRTSERRAAPTPAREKPAPSAAPRAPAEDAPPRAPAVEAPRGAAPTQPATAAPTGTVFAQSDLPDAVRTQLPVLKISGATYSANPVYRMAIVNGQVLHEGDVAAPGLLLEKIEPTRTIWSFKGYRYGLASQ